MFCAHCGKELAEGANYCTACGARLTEDSSPAAVAERIGHEETGGVPAALASGRSRSRLRLSPLVLLVLTLVLATGIAAAAVYVYSQAHLPTPNEEPPTSNEEQTIEIDESAYHYESNHYEFDLPPYWRDRVVVVQEDDTSTIYAKAAYDAGHELQLARIFIQDSAIGPNGDVSGGRIFTKQCGPELYVSGWAYTPALGVGADIRYGSTLEDSFTFHYHVPLDLFEDYLDLATGGQVSIDELRNANSDDSYSKHKYAHEALPPLVFVKNEGYSGVAEDSTE